MTDYFSSHTSAKWEKQASVLRKSVKRLVYSAHIPSWRGEEEAIIADIVQEAICRVLERVRKAERQEALPVNFPEALSSTVAYNLFIDRVRKDKCVTPLSQLLRSSHNDTFEIELADCPEEDIHESMFQESLFNELAPEIADFPKKQRRALLVDLANHTDFNGDETILQKAFLKVGIRLEEYLGLQPEPENRIERSRFASLLSISYKRIARSNRLDPYIRK